MKIKAIIFSLLLIMSMASLVSATPNESIENIVLKANQIENWGTYDDFEGNIQLYIGEEPYYIVIENKNPKLFNGETKDYQYLIRTTEKDIEIAEMLMNSYLANGKLSVFEWGNVALIKSRAEIESFVVETEKTSISNSQSISTSDSVDKEVETESITNEDNGSVKSEELISIIEASKEFITRMVELCK